MHNAVRLVCEELLFCTGQGTVLRQPGPPRWRDGSGFASRKLDLQIKAGFRGTAWVSQPGILCFRVFESKSSAPDHISRSRQLSPRSWGHALTSLTTPRDKAAPALMGARLVNTAVAELAPNLSVRASARKCASRGRQTTVARVETMT
eukprot:scaffold19253_cov124-Isochrysis_galbana.AAC.6